MRGIGSTFSRLPAARAVLAGAALLAGASSSKAFAQTEFSQSGLSQPGLAPSGLAQPEPGQTDDVAMAIPRLAPHGTEGVALPQPLATGEAVIIRRIFGAQARGAMQVAIRDTAQLDATTPLGQAMLGHILADRFLRRDYRATVDQLSTWLNRFSEFSEAPAIYARLRARLPRQDVAPLPAAPTLAQPPLPDPVPEETPPVAEAIRRNPLLDATVHERAAAGNSSSALRLIGATRGLTPLYAAQLRAEVAQALFTRNSDAEALEVASTAARQGGGRVGLADYIAGLAAWRAGRPGATAHFEEAARAELAPDALHAAASFWAARGHLRARDPEGYRAWMQRAAGQPRTFYGLLARRALGLGLADGLAWTRETLGEADVDAVTATPEGLAAFALLQVGQGGRAEAELRRLAARVREDVPLSRAVLLVAGRAGFYDLSAELAALMQGEDERPRDYARFPVPHLLPDSGFHIDPALLYALARVESNFRPNAVSRVGALGLMQIMPQTARYVADRGLANLASGRLHEPDVNLELGQRYVSYLAQQPLVSGSLIRLLACYNDGPGKVAHWAADVRDQGDPLLFIEAIPNGETRLFVQRVLADSWIYAARLHLPAPSLDEMAAGAFPRFRDFDTLRRDAPAERVAAERVAAERAVDRVVVRLH
ncbi:MAG: lytic transglycosylase domain-containing protein [Acidisphaera sp.]|nr:lytic transglycosylase domain-containing protein [Acidisphaera sp.]